ncbi:MAG: hypothetical protein ACOYID_01040 [Eubacteriales bacterium]|jgi:hypothetical protein
MSRQFEITFAAVGEGVVYRYEKHGKTTWSAELRDGILRLECRYDWTDEPLVLTAEAGQGDPVLLRCYPYRLELYVGGKLCDEEWPYGEETLSGSVLADGSAPNIADFVAPERPEPPAVLGSFVGAEGWNPGGGVFVGDCMPYSHEGRYHVLYLYDRHHHASKWHRGAHQWAHISSADMVHWDIHPMAVEIDDPKEGSICTGSWIYTGKEHQLYYTVRMVDGSPAPVMRSVSSDGYRYRKDKSFGFTLSDRYNKASARDPKVVRDAEGLLHMFVTTTDLKAGRGCLAHLVSSDGDDWREVGNIYESPDEREPECSDYFEFGGKYYLIYSLGGRGHYQFSDSPFSGWIVPDDPIIPCSSVPKAAVWNGRIIFTGFSGNGKYAGTMTFREAHQMPDGTLRFSGHRSCW